MTKEKLLYPCPSSAHRRTPRRDALPFENQADDQVAVVDLRKQFLCFLLLDRFFPSHYLINLPVPE